MFEIIPLNIENKVTKIFNDISAISRITELNLIHTNMKDRLMYDFPTFSFLCFSCRMSTSPDSAPGL